MNTYVEYESNNSGGDWWLSDDDWHALEAAGWEVEWFKDKPPFASSMKEDGRWLGALARRARKPGATSIREAAEEWERITGECATDAGCACCGQPHSFTLYRDGEYVESGPEAEYVARWA
jgi:hypothetical protein